jgi:hypothetical protein
MDLVVEPVERVKDGRQVGMDDGPIARAFFNRLEVPGQAPGAEHGADPFLLVSQRLYQGRVLPLEGRHNLGIPGPGVHDIGVYHLEQPLPPFIRLQVPEQFQTCKIELHKKCIGLRPRQYIPAWRVLQGGILAGCWHKGGGRREAGAEGGGGSRWGA